jgi:hypothetical protein
MWQKVWESENLGVILSVMLALLVVTLYLSCVGVRHGKFAANGTTASVLLASLTVGGSIHLFIRFLDALRSGVPFTVGVSDIMFLTLGVLVAILTSMRIILGAFGTCIARARGSWNPRTEDG